MYQICLLRQMSGHAIATVHRHFIAINLINYMLYFIFANIDFYKTQNFRQTNSHKNNRNLLRMYLTLKYT